MTVFGALYSQAYDTLYRDKDYALECLSLEKAFQKYGAGDIKSVLDLGCGTGNHLVPLAQRGYEMSGVDRAEAMLALAEEKARQHDLSVDLHKGDIRTVRLNRTFDAAVMMFAVLGYQTTNQDVTQTLLTVRQHLKPGGLFIFDVWYGPAVLVGLIGQSGERVKTLPGINGGTILRAASGKLDVQQHTCQVNYHLWHLQDKKVLAETTESHLMRYFFPMELELFLECAGFTLLRLGAFPEFERETDEKMWYVMGIAQANP